VLYLTLSDDSNPLFLYTCQIDLPTFLKLRKEQNIFVEFS
jgi:DNA anti-recombination protein RmuC